MLAMMKGHKYLVDNVVFSPNGRSLVFTSSDGSIRIWNIRHASSKVLPVTPPVGYFYSVAFSPDGRYVAAGKSDTSLWIWYSRTHRLAAKWWPEDTSSVRCMVFTPDGKGLMSGGDDGRVMYWDVSLLGRRQGVSTGRVVNEGQGFPLVRTFLCHDVRCVLLLSHNVD